MACVTHLFCLDFANLSLAFSYIICICFCTESVLVTCTFQKSSEIWLLVIICICHGVAAALSSATRAPTDLELVLSSAEEAEPL